MSKIHYLVCGHRVQQIDMRNTRGSNCAHSSFGTQASVGAQREFRQDTSHIICPSCTFKLDAGEKSIDVQAVHDAKVNVKLDGLAGLRLMSSTKVRYNHHIEKMATQGYRRVESIDRMCDNGSWGVSGSAYLASIIVLWLLLTVAVSTAGMHFTERVPFAGTSSWVITAACHPPPTDEDPALGPVCWGRIEDNSESNDGAEQFSFSSSAVIVGPENVQATRQSRVLGVLASLRRRLSKEKPATDT
ncbi:hypothetical protein E8E11_008260 [Didymella keratinophila]|nr:hypothetical protein E8E11_008260 [Didymella keratinophila]